MLNVDKYRLNVLQTILLIFIFLVTCICTLGGYQELSSKRRFGDVIINKDLDVRGNSILSGVVINNLGIKQKSYRNPSFSWSANRTVANNTATGVIFSNLTFPVGCVLTTAYIKIVTPSTVNAGAGVGITLATGTPANCAFGVGLNTIGLTREASPVLADSRVPITNAGHFDYSTNHERDLFCFT